jgi:50S ribosomal protein L16 3-hydroxylase
LVDQLFPEGALTEFRTRAFGKAPYARPCVAQAATPLLTWEVLDALLGQDPDLLVSNRGIVLDEPAPRSMADTRALFARGKSMVIRRCERHSDALARLSNEFASAMGGVAHVQIFVTPGGQRGFGWHYDIEEVFILQTVGRKQYWFRPNTVLPREQLPSMNFAACREETSVFMTATLHAGDLLYLPSGMWHTAKAEVDAMHLSVGVLPKEP